MQLQTRTLSSLVKVFPDAEPTGLPIHTMEALRGEIIAFQIAYFSQQRIREIQVEVESPLHSCATVRQVGLAPSEFPCYEDHDDLILRSTPGLYPDPLVPINGEGVDALPSQWHAVWLSLKIPENQPSTTHPFAVVFRASDGDELSRNNISVSILDASLPPQELIHTEWFHQDCIADGHNVEVHSEAHWALLETYVRSAVAHGINMILTPLFTPPLDTEIGGERPTVQLVAVSKERDRYVFDFSALNRWIDLCETAGVRYFEMSHLATQWGAAHPPKIVARENGQDRKLFGWDDSSTESRYREFLSAFLPQLKSFIARKGIGERVFFHISDEPHLNHLETYRSVAEFIRHLLPEFPFIDALSDYEFYKTGAVQNPIPASNHIKPFLENGVPDLWTYYCCGQYRDVSNRFFNMPSVRNRILGYQLFKFDIKGFLHWGFDFWYTQYSKKSIDPWRVTDAGHGFPSGDPFLVYPGLDGPIDSIRYEVLREALQDFRMFRLAAAKTGKDAVVREFEEGLSNEVSFSLFPADPDDFLRRRSRVTALL